MDTSSVEKRLKETRAVDIMSRFAITIHETATVADLAHLLMRFKISGVPVVTQANDIIGIVTATDLFNMMQKISNDIDQGLNPTEHHNTCVKDIMTKEVISIGEETSLLDIMKLMRERKIHTLPVVSKQNIVGVIGRRDVINACYVNTGIKSGRLPSNT